MSENIAIGAIGAKKTGSVNYFEKIKKYQENFKNNFNSGNWVNGYNTNQLPGMLSEGNLGTAASQG